MYCYASLVSEISAYRKVFNNSYIHARDYYENSESDLAGIIKAVDFSGYGDPPVEGEGKKVFRFKPGSALDGRQGVLHLSVKMRRSLRLSEMDLVYLNTQTGTAEYVFQSSVDGDIYLGRLLQAVRDVDMNQASESETRILRVGEGEQERTYLFEPLASSIMPHAWLGLVLPKKQIEKSITREIGTVPDLNIKYLVMDQHGEVLRGKAETRWRHQNNAEFLQKLRQTEDGFLDFGMPIFMICLKKELGDGQRQVVFYASYIDVLWQIRHPVLFGLGLFALAAVAACVAVRHVKYAVLLPAEDQAAQLLEREAFNRAMLALAPVGICVLRRTNGELLICNEQAKSLLALGLDVGGVWQGLHAYFLNLPVVGMNRPFHGDVSVLAADDEATRHIHFSLIDLQYNDQPVLFCVFTDDSDRKNVELALAAARDAADSANKAKSAFLAMMSHEIRTPLYGVLGTLELLGKTALSPQQHGYLGTVQQSSGNLLQIINDILDFSKIEADQLSLALAPFNAIELAEGVARNFAPLARQKGVDLYCCLQPDVPVLLGDRHRLQQVLSNLVGNAVKFTDSGKIVIRLNGREVEPGRFALDLQVTDSGIGIGKADQARLFEPFTQADDSTARRFGGTGLGLSICRKLVALMGGGIELVSETGLGSSFTVRLPLAITERPQPASLAGVALVHVQAGASDWRENLLAQIRHAGGQAQPFSATAAIGPDDILLVAGPADAGLVQGFAHVVRLTPEGAPAPEWHDDGWHVSGLCQQGLLDALRLAGGQGLHPAAAAAGGEPAAHRGLHVLVVEDHPINQLVMSDQLEQLGCTVTLVADGREALQRWRRGERYDVMLTDVNMPNLDGYALARQLRVDGIGVPIVGVTANAQPEEAARCLAAGMDAHLAKPVSLSSLSQTLRRFWRLAGLPDQRTLIV
ncbi:hypothetical protein BJP62_02455 [Jeongeupia sp. USM3]|nr:hypothetical protein BJP62_02455 [Jeongeupia sp. USM3]